jgi:riboflavin synthase
VHGGGLDLEDVAVGDSIAVNGVCLTATSLHGAELEFDVSAETLNVTSGFRACDRVNLEKSLRLDTRLGGHLVSGHVDAVGEVADITVCEDNRIVQFRYPPTLSRFFARKGSVAVNGVSLTVNEVDGDMFSVNLIAHTLASTNLCDFVRGTRVNLEVDQVARYVERMLSESGVLT